MTTRRALTHAKRLVAARHSPDVCVHAGNFPLKAKINTNTKARHLTPGPIPMRSCRRARSGSTRARVRAACGGVSRRIARVGRFIYPSICQAISPSFYFSVYQSVYPFVCKSNYLSIYLTFYACFIIFLSTYLYVCLSFVSLSLSLSISLSIYLPSSIYVSLSL